MEINKNTIVAKVFKLLEYHVPIALLGCVMLSLSQYKKFCVLCIKCVWRHVPRLRYLYDYSTICV